MASIEDFRLIIWTITEMVPHLIWSSDFFGSRKIGPHDIFTVTDLANSCVTPLFSHPQGSQGCLEKRNHPLSSNLVVWCAKIGPKSKKVRKT